jgi:chemotaxis family two-component system response regulator Rcp1
MVQRPVEVLLIEDSPADARLTREALLSGSVPKRINVVSDGAQALDYLRRKGEFAGAHRPDIVLLDLNLPKLGGLEVLRAIKADEDLRSIAVIVLTTSRLPQDINAAYELLANCYIVKPVELDQFYSTMRGIEEFWMSMATLPALGKGSSVLSHSGGRPVGLSGPKKDSTSAKTSHRLLSPRGTARVRINDSRGAARFRC